MKNRLNKSLSRLKKEKLVKEDKDLISKKTDNARVDNISNTKKNLSLTFRPYIFQKLNIRGI